MNARGHGAPRTTNVRAVRWRLLAGVGLAVAVYVAVQRLAPLLLGIDASMALVSAAVAATAIAALAVRPAVAPLLADARALQARYEAALADALRDPLTGLGNHRSFHEELDRQVASALRYGHPLSLLLLDLDDFKAVNDECGHAGGDRLLRAFGELLSTGVRRADRAFRFGGDEFAVLLPHTHVDGARVVARRLLAEALQPRLRTEGLRPLSFSGGISALPDLAVTGAQLFAQADASLYAAKHAGRTEVMVFDPDVTLPDPASEASSAAVAEVIARAQLRPVYQPIVSFADGRVIGVEGLIRPAPPAPFADPAALFQAAEATGRVTALDLACADAIISGAGDLAPDQFLSVNLSPATMEAWEFTSGTLLAILARYGFPPERLVIELTERQPVYDAALVRSRVEACRRAGVGFAADDVGAGNAGLRLLSEVRFDILKVDVGLVQRSASDGPSRAVLESVVEIAERTGALVIAEGIEHGGQISRLVQLGITAGQGYHLGRPGPLTREPAAPAHPPAAGIAAWRQSIGLTSIS